MLVAENVTSEASEAEVKLHYCARCEKPILEEYLTTVLGRMWHERCLKCQDCYKQLSETCYSRNGTIFCRDDFYRRFAPRCSGCYQAFKPSDMVRKAREQFFHVSCFLCVICHRQLNTGDQLFVINSHLFVCKEDYYSHYLNNNNNNDNGNFNSGHPVNPESFPNQDEEVNNFDNTYNPGNVSRLSPETNRSSSDVAQNNQGDSDDEGGGADKRNSSVEGVAFDEKRRGPRTTIKAKQLEVLKTAFSQTPKPSRHIREELAKETGLPMRVIQVWFQNKRSKERRMKQVFTARSKLYSGEAERFGNFGNDASPNFVFYDPAASNNFHYTNNPSEGADP